VEEANRLSTGALVKAGARFVNGELVEGDEQENEEKDAA
jgi:hypothetical protein